MRISSSSSSRLWIAGAVLCLCCAALGQLTVEEAEYLEVLKDALEATMDADSVKIGRRQSVVARAPGQEEDEADGDRRTEETTLYLRKSEGSDMKDKYAVLTLESEPVLEAEVLALGTDVYVRINSGVSEEFENVWLNEEQLEDLKKPSLVDTFAKATTIIEIADQLEEANIDSITVAADGSDQEGVTCYDVIPSEDYRKSLVPEVEETIPEITHQLCVDEAAGYLVKSDYIEELSQSVIPLEEGDIIEIITIELSTVTFSEFGAEFYFPEIGSVLGETETETDTSSPEDDTDLHNSSQRLRWSSAVFIAAAALGLFY